MYIITATFDAEAALARTSELLALGDSPERLAERLGISRDLAMVKEGVSPASFKRVLADLQKLKQFVELEKKIEEAKAGTAMSKFFGASYQEKQVAKLEEQRRKFGSLIEAPTWFYKQPRIQLLSAIRDYALDGSLQGDAAWIEVEEETLIFPIVQMYEETDLVFATALIAQVERPLKDVEPHFLLEKFEGNRSISFDFEQGIARYYTPAPAH